ncbi:hypothetical protein AB0I92_10740 [Micromonospora chalcea]|uniref:hypothetical protein n=1 Tax=Micromonospora chalcea TaxID=1874 RepID=UPI0033C2110B
MTRAGVAPRLGVPDAVLWLSAAAGVGTLVVPAARPYTAPLLVAGVVVVAATAWPTLRPPVRRTVLAMMLAGAALCLVAGARWSDVSAAFATMCGVFSFVAVVRLLELPMLRRGYHTAIAEFTLVRLRRTRAVWSAATLTYLLSLALSFGGVALAYRSVRAMDSAADEAGSAGVVCRAFIAANLVTPLSPPLAVVLTLTGLTWTGFLPYALALGLVAAMLVPLGPVPRARALPAPRPERGRLAAGFAAMIGCVVVVLVVLEMVTPLSHPAATMTAVLLVVPLWERGTRLPARAVALARSEAGSWREQFLLFGAGGFVVAAAGRWTADGAVGRLLDAAGLPAWALLAGGALAITVLGLAGLYPLTTLIVVTTVLAPLGTGAWPALVAAAALVGTMAAFVLSPLSGLTLLVSALSGRSAVHIGLRWNLPFGLALLGAGGAAIGLFAAVT